MTARVLVSENTTARVEQELLEYIQKYVPKNEGYLAGNSVHFDKEFMKYEFPKVIEYLRYRIIGTPSTRLPVRIFLLFVFRVFLLLFEDLGLLIGRRLEYQDLFKDVGARNDECHATKEI